MNPEVRVVDDLPDLCLDRPSVAIDTETMGLNIMRDRLCLVQLCFDNGECYVVRIAPDGVYPNLRRLLLDDGVLKIFHFARFDVAVLDKFFGILIGNIFCTKIASRLARTYTQKHGLKDLCHELLGVDLSKEQQTSYWGARDLTPEQLRYATGDVLYLHQLREILVDRLEVEGRMELALSCFDALLNIVKLDLNNYNFAEIFNH